MSVGDFSPIVANCTFVNNEGNTGSEIYCNITGNDTTVNIINSLVWNDANDPNKTLIVVTAGTESFVTLDHCAVPEGYTIPEIYAGYITSADCVTVAGEPTSRGVEGTKHVVFDNKTALENLIARGISTDVTPKNDQLGFEGRKTSPDIGAVEIFRSLTVSDFKLDPSSLTLLQGAEASSTVTAAAIAAYSDGTADINPDLTYSFAENKYSEWIKLSDSKVTVKPSASQEPGDKYTAAIRATATKHGVTAAKDATLNVTVTERTYTLEVTAPTFGEVNHGYAQPEAKAITITSKGNSDAKITSVTLSNTKFELNKTGDATITAGTTDSTTYTVQPITGLAVGTHTATITVTYNNNATASADVSIKVQTAGKVATPAFDPAGGKTYIGAQSVKITCSTKDAAIYYTMDGSDPTVDSKLLYENPVSVTESATLKAVAVKANMKASNTATASYTITAEPTPEPTTIPVSNVTLSQTTLSLDVGKTATLKATVTPDNATDKTVTWSSSAPSVATVENGEVKGISAGEATITAKAGDKSANCLVTVTRTPKNVTVSITAISPERPTVVQGRTAEVRCTATAEVQYSDGTEYENVTWSVSGKAVDDGWVTISQKGVVTASPTASVKKGDYDVTVTATAKAGQISNQATRDLVITVTDITGITVKANKATLELRPGETKSLNLRDYVAVTAAYPDGTTKPVTDAAMEFGNGDRTTGVEKDGTFTYNAGDTENGTKTLSYSVTVNEQGYSVTQTEWIVVRVGPEPAGIKTENLPDARATKTYSATIEAKGAGDIKWSLKNGHLPLSLRSKIDGKDFKISGTPVPSDVGTHTFTLRVFNGGTGEGKYPAEREFSIRVKDVRPSSWEVIKSANLKKDAKLKLKVGETFTVKIVEEKGTNVKYTVLKMPDKNFLEYSENINKNIT